MSFRLIDFRYLFLIIFIVYFNVSCIKTPDNVESSNFSEAKSGDILVLSEGLQGYDNSLLSLIKYESGEIIKNYVSQSNNFNLGDTSNDMIINGDTAIIPSSTTGKIFCINITNGKIYRVINLLENSIPRKCVFINDSIAAVTDLFNNKAIIFNYKIGVIIFATNTGPQPEGIEYYDNLIFTANSAYGDFNWIHPDAETISVIDINSRKEIKKIKANVNVIELKINKSKKRLYAAYINLPSRIDSLGGIIEYDLITLNKLREWRTNPRSINISDDGRELYFLNQPTINKVKNQWRGVSKIDLNTGEISNLIQNEKNDIWYSLYYNSFDDTILIGNAKNHNVDGELLIYSTLPKIQLLKKFTVGMNPNTIYVLK